MGYTIKMEAQTSKAGIAVVGCGGTGGFVAEGLCRILLTKPTQLTLIDYDRVEPRNLKRQNFYEGDLGKFKSQALAERLSRKYGVRIRYSVLPYQPEMMDGNYGGGFYRQFTPGLIIGCVDTPEARKSLSFGMKWGTWWLDSGNGENSGQVLIGNSTETETLTNAFCDQCNTVTHLPLPTVQLPSLLAATTVTKQLDRDCAEAVEADEQSPVINQVMASVVLEMVSKLLAGKLTWMGAYLDMDAFTLRGVEAEPAIVARMVGMRKDKLVTTGCQECACHVGRMYGGRPPELPGDQEEDEDENFDL